MATEREQEPTISNIISGIVGDVQTLMRKEIALARTEIRAEVDTAKNAAIAMGIAGAVLGVGGLLLVLALSQGLAVLLGLPIWAGYAIVGLVFAIVGFILFTAAQNRMKQVKPIPEQTVETMKENVEWIKDRTTSDRT